MSTPVEGGGKGRGNDKKSPVYPGKGKNPSDPEHKRLAPHPRDGAARLSK